MLSGIEVKNKTNVVVRPISECSMSCYESKGRILRPTMEFVQQGRDFQHMDNQLKQTKDKLSESFPALNVNGFDWINALDYFVCRSSHGVDIPSALQVWTLLDNTNMFKC